MIAENIDPNSTGRPYWTPGTLNTDGCIPGGTRGSDYGYPPPGADVRLESRPLKPASAQRDPRYSTRLQTGDARGFHAHALGHFRLGQARVLASTEQLVEQGELVGKSFEFALQARRFEYLFDRLFIRRASATSATTRLRP